MKNRQEDKLSMYFAVLSACKRYATAWQSVPAFVTGRQQFADQVAQIDSLAERQQTGVTGASRDKAQRRTAMADLAVQVGNAVEAYALATDDAILAVKVWTNPSTFIRARDTEARQIASRILAEATSRVAALADYGIEAEKIAELDQAIADYAALLVAPRQAITDRKAATSGLLEAIAAADALLRDRLDKLIPVIAARHPDFGVEYHHARRIVRSGSRPRSTDPGEDEPETGETPSPMTE